MKADTQGRKPPQEQPGKVGGPENQEEQVAALPR